MYQRENTDIFFNCDYCKVISGSNMMILNIFLIYDQITDIQNMLYTYQKRKKKKIRVAYLFLFWIILNISTTYLPYLQFTTFSTNALKLITHSVHMIKCDMKRLYISFLSSIQIRKINDRWCKIYIYFFLHSMSKFYKNYCKRFSVVLVSKISCFYTKINYK